MSFGNEMPLTAAAVEGWKTATTQIETLLNPKTLMETFWKRQTRPDGRLLTQTRPTSIQTDIYNTSYSNSNNNNIAGSALVRLGDTQVLAAVSLLIGQCTCSKAAATSRSTTDGHQSSSSSVARGGDIVVLVSTPESSGGGGGGENRDGQAACLLCQSLLQRILHETIDLEQLLIDTTSIRQKKNQTASTTSPSSKTTTTATTESSTGPILAWRLQVTVRVLNNNGNIFDAALLASVAALQQTRLPIHLQYDDEFGGKVAAAWVNNRSSSSSSPPSTTSCHILKMPCLPVPLSMGTFQISQNNNDDNDDDDGDDYHHSTTTNTTRWIVDPTRAEQDVLHNALTVVVNARQPHEILAVEFATSNVGVGTATGAGAGAGGAISTTDLGVAVHMATARAQEVQALFQL